MWLRVLIETQVDPAVDLLLQTHGKFGESISNECQKLRAKANEVCLLMEENPSEAVFELSMLSGEVRQLMSRFRRIVEHPGVAENADKKKRGRRRKYTDKVLDKMQASYNRHIETMDSKAAWNKVAEEFGITSGDAAKMACHRHKMK